MPDIKLTLSNSLVLPIDSRFIVIRSDAQLGYGMMDELIDYLDTLFPASAPIDPAPFVALLNALDPESCQWRPKLVFSIPDSVQSYDLSLLPTHIAAYLLARIILALHISTSKKSKNAPTPTVRSFLVTAGEHTYDPSPYPATASESYTPDRARRPGYLALLPARQDAPVLCEMALRFAEEKVDPRIWKPLLAALFTLITRYPIVKTDFALCTAIGHVPSHIAHLPLFAWSLEFLTVVDLRMEFMLLLNIFTSGDSLCGSLYSLAVSDDITYPHVGQMVVVWPSLVRRIQSNRDWAAQCICEQLATPGFGQTRLLHVLFLIEQLNLSQCLDAVRPYSLWPHPYGSKALQVLAAASQGQQPPNHSKLYLLVNKSATRGELFAQYVAPIAQDMPAIQLIYLEAEPDLQLRPRIFKTQYHSVHLTALKSILDSEPEGASIHIALAGGDATIQHFLSAYAALHSQLKHSSQSLVVHLLPTGRRNTLSSYLSHTDPLYRRGVHIPMQFTSTYPHDVHTWLWHQMLNNTGERLSVPVYRAECWSVANGKKDFVMIPFHASAALGVAAEAQRAIRQNPAVFGNLSVADVLSHRSFKYSAISLRVTLETDRRDYAADLATYVGINIFAVSHVMDRTRYTKHVVPGSPLHVVSVLSGADQQDESVAKAVKIDLPDNASANENGIWIVLDGELYGPFNRVRLGPWDDVALQVAHYLPVDI